MILEQRAMLLTQCCSGSSIVPTSYTLEPTEKIVSIHLDLRSLDAGQVEMSESWALTEEFVYFSLASEIASDGRRFAGTPESAGLFSHGVLSVIP